MLSFAFDMVIFVVGAASGYLARLAWDHRPIQYARWEEPVGRKFRVTIRAIAVDTYYVVAPDAHEAASLCESPNDATYSNEEPPLVEELEEFPPDVIVNPRGMTLADGRVVDAETWEAMRSLKER